MITSLKHIKESHEITEVRKEEIIQIINKIKNILGLVEKETIQNDFIKAITDSDNVIEMALSLKNHFVKV
jgi:hypothetical protein